MANWLSARWELWRFVLRSWWLAALIIWNLASVLFTIRDQFLSPKLQVKLSTIALVGYLDWPVWLAGSIIIVLLGALEGSYQCHVKVLRNLEQKLTDAHELQRSTNEELERERAKNAEADFSGSHFNECLISFYLSDPDQQIEMPGKGQWMGSSYMAISTSLVNTRPTTVTLFKWELRITVEGVTYEPRLEPPDPKDRVTRTVLEHEGFKLRRIERDEELLPPLTADLAFPQNNGVLVWTRWLLPGMPYNLFKDAGVFTFVLTDSRGKTHTVERPAGPWENSGTLVRWR